MTKTLIVVKPFYMLDAGDTLELTKDKDMYESTYNEEMGNSIDDGADVYGSYSSTFKISTAYAKELIEQGYLREDVNTTKDNKFTNIFTEIDSMLEKYGDDLKNVDKDCKDMPQCVKVEKTTVLNNIITVLNHLKKLKK